MKFKSYIAFALLMISFFGAKRAQSQCSTTAGSDFLITTNTTWNTSNPPPAGLFTSGMCNRKIVVKASNKLTIEDIIIDFTSNGQIEVEQYAELYLDACQLKGGCSDNNLNNGVHEGLWHGILVHGDNTKNQTDPIQGVVTATGAYAHISGAHYGIRSINGGVIHTDLAEFYDCYVGIQIEDYANFPLASTIERTIIQVSSNIVSDTDLPLNGIVVIDCPLNGLIIDRSDVLNVFASSTIGLDRATGVLLLHSAAEITLTRVLGWYFGVMADNSGTPYGTPNVDILENDFEENTSHIRLLSHDDVFIKNNQFDNKIRNIMTGGIYGIHAQNCNNHTIRSNTFYWGPTQYFHNVRGIYLKNAGAGIWSNTFTDAPTTGSRNSFRGIVTKDYTPYIEWRCNDFDISHSFMSNSYDVYLDQTPGAGSFVPDQGRSGQPTYNLYNSTPTNQNIVRVLAKNGIGFVYWSNTGAIRHLQWYNASPTVNVTHTTGEAACSFVGWPAP